MNGTRRTIDDLPTPPAFPIIGNGYLFMRDPLRGHQVVERLSNELGPLYLLKFPRGLRLVVLSDADEIVRILKERPEGFRRAARQQEIFNELVPHSNGVFLTEGAEWKTQRRLTMAALNMNNLQRYFEVIRRSGLALHQRFTEAAQGREPLDIAQALNSYTVDITSELVFGQSLDTLAHGKTALQDHFEVVMTTVIRRLNAPYPYWRWFKLPADRAADRAAAGIEAAIAEYLDQARARVANAPELLEQPENMLDAMLAAQHHDGAFTDEQILGNIFVLLVAGEDTTAHTLGWTVWLLASRPDIQERLAQEARAELGDDPFPTDHASVERLDYAEAVLKESLRLQSVTPSGLFEALRDTTICDTQIPAGTEVVLLTREATRHRVGDEAVFRPERWIDDVPAPPKTLAFGAGPRFCPGRNLALIEVKAALAMIARDFHISLDPAAQPVREEAQFTVAPAGLSIILTPRGRVAQLTQA